MPRDERDYDEASVELPQFADIELLLKLQDADAGDDVSPAPKKPRVVEDVLPKPGSMEEESDIDDGTPMGTVDTAQEPTNDTSGLAEWLRSRKMSAPARTPAKPIAAKTSARPNHSGGPLPIDERRAAPPASGTQRTRGGKAPRIAKASRSTVARRPLPPPTTLPDAFDLPRDPAPVKQAVTTPKPAEATPPRPTEPAQPTPPVTAAPPARPTPPVATARPAPPPVRRPPPAAPATLPAETLDPVEEPTVRDLSAAVARLASLPDLPIPPAAPAEPTRPAPPDTWDPPGSHAGYPPPASDTPSSWDTSGSWSEQPPPRARRPEADAWAHAESQHGSYAESDDWGSYDYEESYDDWNYGSDDSEYSWQPPSDGPIWGDDPKPEPEESAPAPPVDAAPVDIADALKAVKDGEDQGKGLFFDRGTGKIVVKEKKDEEAQSGDLVSATRMAKEGFFGHASAPDDRY